MIDGKDVPLNPSDSTEVARGEFTPGQEVAVLRNRKNSDGVTTFSELEYGWTVESCDPRTGSVVVVNPEGDSEKTYSFDRLAAIQEQARRERGRGIGVAALGVAEGSLPLAGAVVNAPGSVSKSPVEREVPFDREKLIAELQDIARGLGPDNYHIDPALRANKASTELRDLALDPAIPEDVSDRLLDISHRLLDAYAERAYAPRSGVSQDFLTSASTKIKALINDLKTRA